ncbi:MAG: hypothetical protein OEY01_03865 [Desulfobulbaceae bacterium]|nr:hypothetical protein [Desulfobulbaceae bacterium]
MTALKMDSRSIQNAIWVRLDDTKTALEYEGKRKIAYIVNSEHGLIEWTVIIPSRYVVDKGNRIRGRAETLASAFLVVDSILLSVGFPPKTIPKPTTQTPADDPNIDTRFAHLELDT